MGVIMPSDNAVKGLLKALDAILTIVNALTDEAHEPTKALPSQEEQAILDLFEPGCILSTMLIAERLGDNADNGALRRRLSGMVKTGLLSSCSRGYRLPDA